MTNSPGFMSMSMLGPAAGCGDLSLCAPHGSKVPRFVSVVLVVLTVPYFESKSSLEYMRIIFGQ